MKNKSELSFYRVSYFNGIMEIDANWKKPQWKAVNAIQIDNYMGTDPQYDYNVRTKLMYDSNNIYVIFKVEDKWIRCMTDSVNGPVWEDSCVEFFFAPDTANPLRYFNIEINCAGTPLMHYNTHARIEYLKIDPEDILKMEISSSIEGKINHEIEGPLTWFLEYKIPLEILCKYSNITNPKPGVRWRANFYKIAEKSSHPHYITWAPIDRKNPDFHLAEFFGVIEFQ